MTRVRGRLAPESGLSEVQTKGVAMTGIDEVEGIGPAHAGKLQAAGVESVEALLEAGGTPQGRAALAEKTGIGDSLILEWVNHADLFRLSGVGSEYADLLEAAGVDSVLELAQRNASNLHATLVDLNEQKQLVRSVPSETQVADWIEQASGMKPAVHH
jgi:predicted flap endonuclease-1-like 5' DNA nuclease